MGVSYLASQSLEQWQVEDAIIRAPISLERKQGEFLYLKCYEDNGEDSVLNENNLKPFLTWDRLFGCIREYLEDEKGEEIPPYWFRSEKWSPDGKGE